MLTYAYSIKPESITVHAASGKAFVWPSTHSRFEEVKQALRDKVDEESIVALMDEVARLADKLASVGDITVTRDGVFYKDIYLNMTVATRILEFIKQELDPEPLMLFLNKLLKNTRKEAVDSLYDFMEANNIPLYADGDFLVYKRVRQDYTDIHSGKMDNSVGKTLEMHPWQVEADRTQTCSEGLHVCSRAYLPHFGHGGRDRVVVCKVNPEHVVAVPIDYNNAKMRVWRYVVVGELTDDQVAEVLDQHLVVNADHEQDGVNFGAAFADSFDDSDEEDDADPYYISSDDDGDEPPPLPRY